jgi:hypothetical protein
MEWSQLRTTPTRSPSSPSGLAGGLGAFLMGAAFDATGSYALMLALFCIVTLIGAALMMRLPYRYRVTPPGESGPELEMLPS